MRTLSRLLTVSILLLCPACSPDEKVQVERPASAQEAQAMPVPEAKGIQVDKPEVKPEANDDRSQSEPVVPSDKKAANRKTKKIDSEKQAAQQQAAQQQAAQQQAAPAEAGPVFKKHTISLLIGHGRLGTRDFDLEAVQKDGLLFGGQYAYHWDQDWSTIGMVTSNNSLMAGAGYSFADARHTISLLIGHDRLGTRDFDLEAVQKDGLLFGAQYAYNWNQDWSVIGMVTSNNSLMAGAGYSFNL